MLCEKIDYPNVVESLLMLDIYNLSEQGQSRQKIPSNRHARQIEQSVVVLPNPAQQNPSLGLYDAPVAFGSFSLTNLAHASSPIYSHRLTAICKSPLTNPVTNPHFANKTIVINEKYDQVVFNYLQPISYLKHIKLLTRSCCGF